MSVFSVLKRCDLFLGLDNQALQRIADLSSCQEKTYQAREIIIEAGEKSTHLYVLEEGQVNQVVQMSADVSNLLKQAPVYTITHGGIFGWSALAPPHIVTLTAVTAKPSRVIAISGRELRALFDEDTRIGYEVMTSLVQIVGARFKNIEQFLRTGKRSPFFQSPKTVR